MFKLTVIIPVYNSEKFLERSINSILESSIKDDIEIIIVDDASNGNCKEIVKKYDKNIKYIRHKTNLGLFRARLTGIENANGEYIAHLDADDYVTNDIYNKAYHYLKENNQEVIIFNMQNFDDENNKWINKGEKIYKFKNKSGLDLIKEIFFSSTFNWTIHACWNKIIKKSIFDNAIRTFNNIKHLNLSEDLLWSVYIFLELKNTRKISSLDEIGLNYYLNTNSITKKYSYKSFKKNISDIEYCYSEIIKLFQLFKMDQKFFIFIVNTKLHVLKAQYKRFPLYYLLINPYKFIKFKFNLLNNNKNSNKTEIFFIETILNNLNKIPDIKNVYIYGNNKFSEKLNKALTDKHINVIKHIVSSIPTNSIQENCIEIDNIKNSNLDTVIISSIANFYEIKNNLERNNIYIKNIIGIY